MLMKRFSPRQIAFAGIVAALYAAITILCAPFSYGAIQFRLAEALIVLCCFTPSAIWGLVLGCIGANILSSVGAFDILFGTLATLLSCVVTARLKRAWLIPLPAVVFNALIVGAEIAFFVDGGAFWSAFALNALTVGLGEAAVMYLLGVPLYLFLQKSDAGQKLRTLGAEDRSRRS